MGLIGLIDVDGHHFPNLALMRISAWHKSQGDEVEWWWSDFVHYDIVYMSKIFSDAYSKDIPEPMNADKVIKGGTGYQIHLVNGKEVYDKETDRQLPPEIEKMKPDYTLYPQFDFCLSYTTRGCPRNCPWCHVAAKEGKISKKIADLDDFYDGQRLIQCCDPNITACKDKRDLLQQYRETGAVIEFNQGLDIRLINEADIDDINQMKIKNIHFAWDDAKIDLTSKFAEYRSLAKHKPHGRYGTVYCLTNFNSTMEENLWRIYTLRDMGYDPYVMIYDKPHAPKEIKRLQRWCNNRKIFGSTPKFEDY